MARAKVVHSEDAVTVIFAGDKQAALEPSTGIIKFPGGSVEVTRTSEGAYWAHIAINDGTTGLIERDEPIGEIVESRVDYTYAGYRVAEDKVPPIPLAEYIKHYAVLIRRRP